MTQTRTFLILAWLMVATLLWMEWGKGRDAAAAPAPANAYGANIAAMIAAAAAADLLISRL